MNQLGTDRLILRPWRNDDFEPFAAYQSDEELARFVGGACSRDVAWRRMAAIVGHWQLRGFGYWVLEERSTGAFAGAAGLWFPEGWPELEVGYWLFSGMQGKGYATEAATRARDFAFEDLGATSLVSYIHPDNGASIRVAERMGARREAAIELSTHGPHLVYRHSR